MNIIVQKYGGSSIENKEKMEIICNRIIEEKNNENSVVTVVSAQGKTTNNLISKAENYSKNIDNIDKKSLDFLLSTGEMVSASLLSIMLNSRNIKAVCLNGCQAGIITDSTFGSAKILNILTENILNYLKDNYVVIITGFQGIDSMGNITTLGRGGSDLSAVALSCALKASKCEILSDINGIFSADPKIIQNAKKLDFISYDEMLEASSGGAKVLHDRSVNLAKTNNLKIFARGTFSNNNGTEVTNVKEEMGVHIISKKDKLTKVCIVGQMLLTNTRIMKKIYSISDELNIKIYMISVNEIAINLVVDSCVATSFMKKLHESLIEEEN